MRSASPLRVVESDELVEGSLFGVAYAGRHYAVPDDPNHRTPTAFRVLHALYQMAVAEVPGSFVPSVTIAK